MHIYFETLGKYLLFTKYLTIKNMPSAQQKNVHKKYWSHTAQIREALPLCHNHQLCNKLTAAFNLL